MLVRTYQNNFKHKDNIKSILSSTGLPSILPEDSKYYIGGGYAVALLFAPRTAENLNKLSMNYYSDIDLFFPNELAYQKVNSVFELLRPTSMVSKQVETENATTYTLYTYDKDGHTTGSNSIQLVKKYIGTPQDILSTFDILNARILYNPNEDVWYADEKAFSSFSNKKISLTDSTPLLEEDDGIFFQLERLSKYISRYDLELNNETLYRLIKLNREKPHLSFQKNQRVEARGYYSRYSYNVSTTFNVWQAFKELFTKNKNWNKVKPLLMNVVPEDEDSHEENPF